MKHPLQKRNCNFKIDKLPTQSRCEQQDITLPKQNIVTTFLF